MFFIFGSIAGGFGAFRAPFLGFLCVLGVGWMIHAIHESLPAASCFATAGGAFGCPPEHRAPAPDKHVLEAPVASVQIPGLGLGFRI